MSDSQSDNNQDDGEGTEKRKNRIPHRRIGKFGTKRSSQQIRGQRYGTYALSPLDYDASREVILEEEDEELGDYWTENLPPHWSL